MPISLLRHLAVCLMFCLLPLGLPAQVASPKPAVVYRNLVMEGGGIRGIAYGGALAELEKQGVLAGIRRVGGTSAGAIQAALLAVGYSPQEIIDVVNHTPVQRLNDGRLIFFGGSTRLVKQYGWYRGDQFTKYLGELVQRKTQNPNLTLGQLHALTETQPTRYRDLYTTGTNLTTQRVQVFSYETHPDMRVADAVRISMSIPLYFRAVLLDRQGHVVRQPAKGQEVEVLVDGGLLANYPINLFDDVRYLSATAAGMRPAAGPVLNPETLGLRLDRAEQIAYDTQPGGRRQLAPYQIQDFGSYMGALYTVAIETLNAPHPEDWARTVSISTLGFNPKIKRVSDAQKQQLMDSGRSGVQAFFAAARRK
ncbi:patatin-like phospholipase family protein [Hymenobacter sp. BT186]|uniref:Patatin-like phospholipase family protein n=1 Tax=Hymenobacter telluris TaxID=2816474 RepID=A0A939F0F0_9BACT|nr:patatin-like phospholipase family protein [Hymenobacter telluris]MBO0360544.1 patatin-like phospholipase family protein [Hymenobacter telluris]MBW3376571.1 patatin-like phospholipase family protein [Hymenobacter norwichensis]